MKTALFMPDPGDISVEAVRRWFENIPIELHMSVFSDDDRAGLARYYAEAGLLRPWRQPFFWRHYAETFANAAAFLLGGRSMPLLLDMGCGTGTQTLFLALNGARVLSVDTDAAALRVLRKRKAIFEELAGRRLPIEILEENAFAPDYRRWTPIDGVYSLFAFNMMQPSGGLIDALLPSLSEDARLAVLDGNRVSVWAKVAPWRRRRVWSPAEMRRELESRGFDIHVQRGAVALPPPVWAILPARVARALDSRLCDGSFWPVSYQTLAVRRRGTGAPHGRSN